MLPDSRDWNRLTADFRWSIPQRFNIAAAACDRLAAAEPDRPALVHPHGAAGEERWTYGALALASRRLAAALRGRGIAAGDRVAILLPQRPQTLIAHLALYRLGAVAVPLAALFGVEAIAYRMADAGCRALVTDQAGFAKLAAIETPLPALEFVVAADGPSGGALGLPELIAGAAPLEGEPMTGPDDPAVMVYTSGTTGQPKGTLHGHRVLLGHLPGFALTHGLASAPDGLPRGGAGELFWTPSDWAWCGGLFNALLPALACGLAVVTQRFAPFDPEAAFALLERAGVARIFLPPTALRLLATVEAPRERFRLALASLGTAGESLGAATAAAARAALGVPADEFYGQTECNYVLGSVARLGVARDGAIGRPLPGHDVRVLREDGSEAAVDEPGEITVAAHDPGMFLRYWNAPEATAAKFREGRMLTGDRAVRDAEGYVRFLGRNDDLITSAGYRIGPAEIEDCLARHPAVALAAVVGRPDPLRTEVVRAFVTLKAGFAPSEELAREIRSFVRARLSAHEYPRELRFVEALPLTTTGKVIRRALRELP